MSANHHPSQAAAILDLLRSSPARDPWGWVSMPVLARDSGAYAVHSCVAELRGKGHRIENRVERRQDGTRLSWYRLVQEEGGVTCATCIHHVQDWRLCLHPDSQAPGFWRDPQDYACHTPAKDVPETNFGKIATQPTLSPTPARAMPGNQAPS